MKLVHGSDMEYTSSGLKHRPGAPLFKYLLLGEEDSPSNFFLMLARQEAFYSPRHHHNFEQFRFAYKGDITLGEGDDWILREGEVAYFPEGSWYGPQNDGDAVKEVLVLQFGGPSGQGYLSYAQLKSVQEEMNVKGIGRFEGGKFIPKEDPSKAVDGYEGLWEYKNGRKLEYPVARYRQPLLMNTTAFRWQKIDESEAPGTVEVKPLGVFSDGSVAANFFRLRDASMKLHPKKAIQLLFVFAGTGKIDDQGLREQSAVQLSPGEEAQLSAQGTQLEVLHFALPTFPS
ncbi:hypothetical protein H2204_012592 [Knufia peltigerae]|uniref:Cupin type-2 domain-containing protein n=1 Tax=Knufia peltigerae TaxID=1002370 RepID=A0AA38XS91_9EURO|nr:hypothetical protein H2204_012592 [Knufia peltigerae]